MSTAALARRVPLGFDRPPSIRIRIDGYVPAPDESMQIDYDVISPDYFRTLEIPIVSGRAFTSRDDEEAPRVVIVNAAMARRYWPQTDVVGRRLRIADQPLEIVGVVPTGNTGRWPSRPGPTCTCRPVRCCAADGALRARGWQSGGARVECPCRRRHARPEPAAVRRQNAPDAHGICDRDTAAGSFAPWSLRCLALLLAAVGLHSVLAYTVSQRTREVAIRLARGRSGERPRARDPRGHVAAVAGLGIGMTIAYGALPLMSPLLIGISAKNP